MLFHIWDFLNADFKISVDLKKEFKDKIKFKIENNIYNISKRVKISPIRIYEYFIYQKSAIPLDFLYKIIKLLSISLEETEKNIIMIKQLHVPSTNSIKNPKLPITITPYLTSLVANLFFDGSVPEDGKGTYYNQKNKEIMEDFIKKVKEIFGEVSYSLKLDHRGVLKCRIPRLIGELCRYIYKVKSFGTFDSRVPDLISNLNKEHKISFIITGILDEGSITYDGDIQFGVSNKDMILDFKNLCRSIGLETTEVRGNKSGEHYHLYIRSKDKFNKIYINFNKKNPLLSLRYKEERLKKSIEIKKQKFLYTKDFSDNRKMLLLTEIRNKESSVNLLSIKFLIPPKTVRRYMYQFMKEGKIIRKKSGNEYIYFVPH